MRINKSELSGTASVYGFTLSQMLKSKANAVTLIIMLVMALAMPPFAAFMGADGAIPVSLATEKAYVNVQSEYTPMQEDLISYSVLLSDLEVVKAPSEDYRSFLSSKDVYIVISDSPDGVSCKAYTLESFSPASYEVDEILSAFSFGVERARLRAIGEDRIETVSAPYSVTVYRASEYASKDEVGAEAQATSFGLQYIYAIAVLMLVAISSTYIIRSVLEEKASKLVELLMISVRPLAMLVGKILATMTYVFGLILAMIGGYAISSRITSMFVEVPALDMLMDMGLTGAETDLGVGFIAAAFVSLLLSFLTMSVISGISGACCSNIDEMGSANTAVMLLTLTGYLVSMASVGFPGRTAAHVLSLIPVISTFCAPVQFAAGNIGFGVLLLSWLIQAAVICLLCLFCAKVYAELIIHKGTRIKLKQLFAMAKGKE